MFSLDSRKDTYSHWCEQGMNRIAMFFVFLFIIIESPQQAYNLKQRRYDVILTGRELNSYIDYR